MVYEENTGPVLSPYTPDIAQKELNLAQLSSIYTAISLVKETLSPTKDLIGFAGAPWTLACYMLEGRGTKAFDKTKLFGFSDPAEMERLIQKLTRASVNTSLRRLRQGRHSSRSLIPGAGPVPLRD